MTQLTLDTEPERPNLNVLLFHPDGSPRNLLWPGDDVRMAHDRGEHQPGQPECPLCAPWPLCPWGCCRVRP